MNVDAIQFSSGQPLAAAAVPVPAPAPQLAEQRELVQAVRAVNAAELFGYDRELTFALDRETSRPVVRLVDRNTNEVIRQIPPEYLLRMAAELRELEASD